ncbi:MAG: hypothetical protein R2909_09940 [Gemmatimonadales bacterium]
MPARKTRRTAFRLVACVSLLAAPASAQLVVARVSAPAAAPVAGVLLTLVAPDGSVVARALSNERGVGILRPGRAGRFLLKVDRIGYLGHTIGPFALAARDTLPLTVAAPTERVALPELAVGGTGVEGCELAPAEAEVTELLWREAKKALTSSVLPTDSSFMLEVARYQRTYSAAGSVTDERSRRDSTRASISPFVAADPAELAERGYHRRRGGNHRFFAPDAGTVLSDEFVRSHCFRALPADSGLVGLAFKPSRRFERRTEVSGALWLDHTSLELRRIDFEYLNVEKELASGHEGGSMSFGRLPNGRWIVAAWRARVGYSEQGGEVSLVEGNRPDASGGVSVTGTVFDSTSSSPIAGAVVTIAGGYQAATASDGSFTLHLPNTGVFEVRVAHPVLERFDAPRAGTVAAVIRGQQVRHDVAVPSVGTLARIHCRNRPIDLAGEGLLLGRVLDPAGGSLSTEVRVGLPAGTPIRAGYRAVLGNGAIELRLESDGAGRFAVCGIPDGTEITVSVGGSSGVDPIPLRVRAGAVSSVEVVVP